MAPKNYSGLVKKNLREVSGVSLVDLAIQSASHSSFVDKIIIVSDDRETLKKTKSLGFESRAEFVYKHPEKKVEIDKCATSLAVSLSDFDYISILDVSTPLRLSKDIDNALMLCQENQGCPVVTVSDTGLSEKNLHYIDSSRGLGDFTAKSSNKVQLHRKIYELNFSVMVASRQSILEQGTYFSKNTKAYLIPRDRALYINSKLDLAVAETLVTQNFFNLPQVAKSNIASM